MVDPVVVAFFLAVAVGALAGATVERGRARWQARRRLVATYNRLLAPPTHYQCRCTIEPAADAARPRGR